MMGNVEVTDLSPVRHDERQMLDLSRKVNQKQFIKHIKGEYSERCILDIPWEIVDSISLYERMDVSFNRITCIPIELPLRIPHLCHLNISYNQIAELPESFGLFFHMRTLILTHNVLAKLPESFTRLVKLEKVDASHNALRELPEEMGEMECLRRLNVCHNKLKNLPESLGRSETLEVILASNNRSHNPPQSICDQGSAILLKFLRRQSLNKPLRDIPKLNVFPRHRGNILQSSVTNPDSARAQYVQSQTQTLHTASRIKTPLLPPSGASKLDANDLRDKIVGMIYGAAIGDALGMATEFMSPDECNFHYDPSCLTYSDIVRDQHRVKWKKGDWTTDFDQMMLVLDSVIQWGGVVDELDFAQRLHDWSLHGYPELGDTEGIVFSNTVTKVLENEDFLQKPHLVAEQVINARPFGNGCASGIDIPVADDNFDLCDNAALVRSLILGIPHFHNLDEISENAARICKSTHADPRCVAAATCVAMMVAVLLQGDHDMSSASSVEQFLSSIKHRGMDLLTHFKQKKEFEHYMNLKSFDSVNILEPSKLSFVLKPLSVGVIALRNRKDFRSTVVDVIMRGGDANTNAAIAGALLGCINGYSQLPPTLITGLRTKQRQWLNQKINFLLDMMAIP